MASTAKLISFKQIMSEQIPPVDWMMKPLIAKGDRVVLYGEWGSFKSYLLTHWALAWAADSPAVGPFTIPTPRRVLYIDEEIGERGMRRRIQRVAAGMGLNSSDLSLFLVPRPRIRFDGSGVKRLLTYVEQAGLQRGDVIIYESFRRGLIGTENDQKDVTEFLRSCQEVCK
jgi:RecA-family ATPase